MNNKLLLPLLGVLAALLGFAWYALRADTPGTAPDRLEELGPSAEPKGLATGGPASLPDPVPAAEAPAADRTALVEEAAPERVTVARSERSVPADAIWVEGRVVFPDALPLDGGELEITARGRRFGGKKNKRDVRREYVTKLKDDRTFRVAFAEDTRKGWITVEGRYLYLPEKHALNLRERPGEVVLEPKLGGILTGAISLPVGVEWTEATREKTKVRIGSWGGGGFFSRNASVGTDGRYELTGLPPGASYDLSIESEFWCGVEEGDLKVEAGEITTFDAQLTLGATVLGRVVDGEGVGRSGVPVELFCDPVDDGWHRQSKQTEEDGRFAFHGIVEGEVTLKAGEKDHLTVEKELGVLHPGDRREDVTLTLDEGGFIAGMVQWPDGTPADGALVTVDQERATRGVGFGFGDTRLGKAAADGTFHISGLEDSACVVRASARSYRPDDLKRAAEREKEGKDPKLRRRGPTFKVKLDEVLPGSAGLLLVLEQGDSVSGRVVDDRGEPVTRFLISADPEEGGPENLEDEDGFNRVVISLDGRFKVDGLRDGTWTISAKATGHARSNRVLVISPGAAEVELVAPRLAEIHGVVRDAKGATVSGATVWIESVSDEEEAGGVLSFSRSGYWGGSATTDELGRYEAKDVSPGNKKVVAGLEGAANSEPMVVSVPAGETVTGADCHLREAARITGEVHASTGPIDDREITVRGVDGTEYWENVQSDSSGRFELTGLDPGTYQLDLAATALGDGEQDWTLRRALTRSETVSLREGERTHVVLGAPPANPIRVHGSVTSGGQPVAGTVVSCQANGAHEGQGADRTAGDGSYGFTLGAAGSYRFQVGTASSGRLTFVREVPALEEVRFDFELPTASISGLVRDADGSPSNRCRVELEYLGDGEQKKHVGHRRAVSTDSNGHYAIEHLHGGSYVLRATPGGGRWGRSSGTVHGVVVLEDVTLAAGEVREGLNIDLEEGGTVVGTVLGSGGLPVEGASIHVTTESGRSLDGWGRSRSDGRGRFRREGLAPGRYQVQARQNGEASRSVTVRVYSSTESEIELALDG